MPHPGRVLIIDDDEAVLKSCRRALTRTGHEVDSASRSEAGLELLGRWSFDVVLLDLRLPDMPGLEVLKRIKALDPEVSVVIISGYGTVSDAVEAMKLGAFDFLPKPFTPEELRLLVKRALERRQLDLENLYLRQELKKRNGEISLVFESGPMAQVMDMLRRVAPTDATILLTGESGTGKGLIARTIHQLSTRRGLPFVSVDCGSLVKTLFESELFGHVKGSFTGADENKVGKFELAAGGTIFFDEISNISLEIQAKLLKAVEERTVARVGSAREQKIDCRIIAATHQDLEKAIQEGIFREDLYYRLNVVSVHLPPLRKRPDDVALLVEHFIPHYSRRLGKDIKGVKPEVLQVFKEHTWPGNVRELENTIERLVIFSPGPMIGLEDLVFARADFSPAVEGDSLRLRDVEKSHIVKVLKMFYGARSKAAQALGIDRKTLREKIRRYEIRVPSAGG